MPTTRVFTTTEMSDSLLQRIRTLLDVAFAGGFSDDDWEHTLGGWHAVVSDGEDVLAHAAVVERTLEAGGQEWRTGYVEGVATVPSGRGEGLGSFAMAGVMDVVRAEFELGALSTSRHPFYERLGWERWRGQTSVRDRGSVRRTPDEDDGVMVLRFGPSLAIDLTGPLVCEARQGDDW